MQWLIWLVVLLAAALGGELFHICRQRRELDRLSKSVEHFLLYPEDDIEETLNEGAVANLQNAFSELTAQFSLMRAASAHREEEMTHFVENIAPSNQKRCDRIADSTGYSANEIEASG